MAMEISYGGDDNDDDDDEEDSVYAEEYFGKKVSKKNNVMPASLRPERNLPSYPQTSPPLHHIQ
jgi:hypothetical protein